MLSIPSALVLCVPTITSDPMLGDVYKTLLQKGVRGGLEEAEGTEGGEGGEGGEGDEGGEGGEGVGVDERTLVMLFLLLEIARGEESFWAP